MSDTSSLQQDNDETTVGAFLDFLSASLNMDDLRAELPIDVISFAESCDLSPIDVDEVIIGPMDI